MEVSGLGKTVSWENSELSGEVAVGVTVELSGVGEVDGVIELSGVREDEGMDVEVSGE